MVYDSLLRLPYGISKRLNFPAQSLQQASRQLVGVTSHMRFTFWNKSTSTQNQNQTTILLSKKLKLLQTSASKVFFRCTVSKL